MKLKVIERDLKSLEAISLDIGRASRINHIHENVGNAEPSTSSRTGLRSLRLHLDADCFEIARNGP